LYKAKATLAQVDISNPPTHEDVLTAAKGGGILFVGQIIEEGSTVIFAIMATRTLGAAGYGIYNIGIGAALILATIAMLGLPEGMTRFLPFGLGEHNSDKTRSTLFIGIGLSSVIGLSIGIIFFILGDVLAINLFHEPSAASVIRLFSIIIPLEAVGRVLLGAAIGLKRGDYYVYSYSIGFSVVRLGFTALFLYIGWDVVGVVIAYSLAWIVAIGMLLHSINREVPLSNQKHIKRGDVQEIVSFSAPLCLTEITLQFRGYVDILLMGLFGIMMASVGIYSAVTRVQSSGNMLLSPIANIAKPLISDLDHRSEMARLKHLYQALTRWSLSFMLPLVATIILFPQAIMSIFGNEFVIGVPVLLLVGLGMLLNAATRICHPMVSMTGHSTTIFITTLFSLILNVIFDILFIPQWGMVGAAASTVLAIAIVGLVRLIQVYLFVGLWPYNWTFAKPLIATTIALLVGFLANKFFPAENNLFFFIADVLILWSIYMVATVILGLSEEDHAVLSQLGRRLKNILSR
jgi:O-antigen/teichoic acid export membrane protein